MAMGVEDQVDVFWDSEGREVGQIGMDLAPKGSPYGNAVFLCVNAKILMVVDQDGDDKAEVVQAIAEGWPPARAGVDVTGLALHSHDGSVWFGLAWVLVSTMMLMKLKRPALRRMTSVVSAVLSTALRQISSRVRRSALAFVGLLRCGLTNAGISSALIRKGRIGCQMAIRSTSC